MREEIETLLELPAWAGAKADLVAKVRWPTPVDFDAGRGQGDLLRALNEIRSGVDGRQEPWRSLLR